MTIGSPALAAYSLALTTLNSRFVYIRASRIPHESKTAVARALISLQQIPLELTKDKRLLAFIPVGDQWRREIIDRLDRRSTRSIAMASSIAWVIIAFLFTLVDSFVSIDSPDGASEGLSVGILWLWLLCIVISWLWIPTFTYDELKSALYHANEKAADKAAKRLRQQASMAYNSTRVQIRNRLPGRALNSPVINPASRVPEENEKVKEESVQGFGIRAGQKVDQKTNRFINAAHHRSTVSFRVPPKVNRIMIVSVSARTHPQTRVSSACLTRLDTVAPSILTWIGSSSLWSNSVRFIGTNFDRHRSSTTRGVFGIMSSSMTFLELWMSTFGGEKR